MLSLVRASILHSPEDAAYLNSTHLGLAPHDWNTPIQCIVWFRHPSCCSGLALEYLQRQTIDLNNAIESLNSNYAKDVVAPSP